MNSLSDSIISHLRLIAFYKEFISVKNLPKELLNITIRSSTSFPLSINLLLSDKCNFFCEMCSWRNSEDPQDIADKGCLDMGEIEKFISQVKVHRPIIHIGGGEPFTHRNLLEIAAIIKNNRLKCLITTNGFLMDESIIEEMVKLKIDALIFSLYGPEEIHDAITKVNGSFKKTIANLKSILSKRTKYTKVLVSTLPLPENINELKQLIRNLHILGVDRVKIEQLNFITLKEYKDSVNNKGDFNLTPSTLIKDDYFNRKFAADLISMDRDIHRAFGNFVYLKPHLNETELINWYSAVPSRLPVCFFITHSLFINYNGDVIPCQFFKDCILGNIREDTLEFIWRSHKYKMLRENINRIRPIACSRCCKN